jgi:hypothetical protein
MNTQANRGGVAKLWLLNFIGNAAALAAWYFWLLVPDAHGWQVAGSLLAAACIIALVVWLRAGTFVYFRLAEFRESGAVWRAFRHSLRHLAALAMWAVVLAALLWFLIRLRIYPPQLGVWLWQKLPESLRFASPRHLTQYAEWLLWFLILVVVPAIWLPIATTVAVTGFGKGLARSWHVLKRPMYWVWFCFFVLVGVYLPHKLIWWIPALDNLRKQAWSMSLRFLVAYLLLITAWIALVWMVGVRTEADGPNPSFHLPPER